MSHAVNVVPTLAPMMTPIEPTRSSKPALTKLTTITVVAEELWIMVVINRPVITPFTRLDVIAVRMVLILLPATFCKASLIIFIPKRNTPNDPVSYTHLLQALIYRKMHVDDIEDYVLMGSLSYTPTEPAGAEPILLINSKGMAEFKVLPKTFDTKKATYEFFDTHISRTEKDPIALTYVDGSAKVNDGILSVEFTSSNLVEGYYLSSMNVTLNKNTACSDYFAVRVKDYKVNEAVFFIQTADVKVEADQVDDMLAGTLTNDPYHYEFCLLYTSKWNTGDKVGARVNIQYTFVNAAEKDATIGDATAANKEGWLGEISVTKLPADADYREIEVQPITWFNLDLAKMCIRDRI